MRDCYISNVGSDCWRAVNNLFMVNVTVDRMNPNAGAHPDLIQFYNQGTYSENVILYNIRALNMESQGFFGVGGKDVAFVNVLTDKKIITALPHIMQERPLNVCLLISTATHTIMTILLRELSKCHE